MATVKVKETGRPMADRQRQRCMEAINGLSDTEVINLMELVNSKAARSYLGNPIKFKLLKKFM